jgi:molecular chaperone Hsp33
MKNSCFLMMMLVTLSTRQALFRPFAVAFSITPTGRKSLMRYSTESESNESSKKTSTVDDRLAEYQNKNNVRDQAFSAISKDGSIKVTVATVRNIVNDIMIMQKMTEVPADAIGRLVSCSLLISNGMQAEQTFQVTMNGDGPLRGAMAISTGSGQVRGYAGSPGVGGGLTLQEAVGKGSVQVVKNHPDWPNPYNAITSIRNGDIDRDIGIYLAESEQRSCALAAATSVNGLLCKAAGGYLVEKLPGCDQETAKQVEKNLAKLVEMDGGDKLPTNLLLKGVTPVEIAEIILNGLDMQPLQQIEPKYVCECSEERLFRALRLLPKEEVEEILAKEEQIEARCHFCGKEYRMSPQEVEKRFATAKGDPSKD